MLRLSSILAAVECRLFLLVSSELSFQPIAIILSRL